MATKVFSVEQLRLNNELLSGDALNRLWFAGSQLAAGSTAVPTGFDVVAGAGLVGGGTMDGSNVVLDVNLLAADPGLRLTGVDNDFLQVHEITDTHVKPLAGIDVTKLAASGITINAGNGISAQNNGVINLGHSQTIDIDLGTTPGLDFASNKLVASDIDNSHIKLLAGIHVTKLAASGVTIGAGHGIEVENAGVFNLGEEWDVGVKLNGTTLSKASAGLSVDHVPNSLTLGYGLDYDAGTTYDGGAARAISLDPSEAVLMTGNQSIDGVKDFIGEVHVHGNLTVDGTTTTVDSTVVNIGDNIIVLNNDASNTSESSDGGFLIKRFVNTPSSNTQANASLLWDNSESEWRIGEEGKEEPVARGKTFSVGMGAGDDEETVNIAAGGWQSAPTVHATVSNSVDTNPDMISCMVTSVNYTNSSTCTVDVILSAKPATANYVLELICMA